MHQTNSGLKARTKSPPAPRPKTNPMPQPLIPSERIEKAILLIRGQKVMLDSDLAKLYGVQTKVRTLDLAENSVVPNCLRAESPAHSSPGLAALGIGYIRNCGLKARTNGYRSGRGFWSGLSARNFLLECTQGRRPWAKIGPGSWPENQANLPQLCHLHFPQRQCRSRSNYARRSRVLKVLNQAVKRHSARFPDDFAFQLTRQEFTNL